MAAFQQRDPAFPTESLGKIGGFSDNQSFDPPRKEVLDPNVHVSVQTAAAPAGSDIGDRSCGIAGETYVIHFQSHPHTVCQPCRRDRINNVMRVYPAAENRCRQIEGIPQSGTDVGRIYGGVYSKHGDLMFFQEPQSRFVGRPRRFALHPVFPERVVTEGEGFMADYQIALMPGCV